MRKITTAAVAGALIVPGATSTPAAGASTQSVIATYHGKQIALADGWQGAHACLALTVDNVRCYDTEAEMRDSLVAAARRPVPSGYLAPSTTCSSPGTLVTLYADIGFGGDSLSFASTTGWTNLAPFGFTNDMESWSNSTACNSAVADGTGGGGDRLTLAAHSSSSNVGTTWKNRASSINVAP